MFSKNMYRKVTFLALVAIILLAATAMNSRGEAVDCEVTISIGDTTAFPNTTNIAIPIYIDHLPDTIIGFKLAIHLGRTGLIYFPSDSVTVYDTLFWKCNAYSGPNCIDSTSVFSDSPWDFFHVDSFEVFRANFDTAGTLIAGWEIVSATTYSEFSTIMIIAGIADIFGGPITPGFAPQSGGTFFNVLVDVFEFPDTLGDQIIPIRINTAFTDNFGIVTTDPDWSPWTFETYWDTNFFLCTEWDIDTTQDPPDTIECLSWQQTAGPSWDSIEVVLDSIASLDTLRICITDGSLEVLQSYVCGDANADGTAGNILDLTFLVDRIFRGGPPSDPMEASDLNCDGDGGNILDLTTAVDFIFRGGDPVCSAAECSK